MNALLIEDNELELNQLISVLSLMPDVTVKAVFKTFSEAASWLREQSVDLIISDVELPDMNAIQGFKALKDFPPVILVTSHPEFALEGYEMNAVHFLTKPVEPAKMIMALQRINRIPSELAQDIRFIPDQGNYLKIELGQITHITAKENYSDIHLLDGSRKTVLTNLTQLLRQLDDRFFRVHKGYAVNLSQVTKYDAEHLLIGKTLVPVGNGYKNLFLEKMQRLTIRRKA